MDFFTFIIIGIVIYSFFSKKDKPPQRARRPADQTPTQSAPQEPTRPVKKKEGFFESLERQIRESAEAFEKELETGRKTKQPGKTTEPVVRTKERTMERTMDRSRRSAPKTVLEQESYGVEGAWGVEGRAGLEGRPGVEGHSDYSKYQSKQGKVLQADRSVIEKTSIEAGTQAIGSRTDGLQKAVGFNSSAIVQGIIWSEILKEPRGKRPFNRR